MTQTFILNVVFGALMILSAGLTKLITPNVLLATNRPAHKLDSIIPAEFGPWKEDQTLISNIINPQRQELLNKLYSQTLSRTYVNGENERIMLSIAYGTDQRDGNALHYPEVCYPAQGFQIKTNHRAVISTSHGSIAVRRLETNFSNQRYEPVTYWAIVGDVVADGAITKKLAEMSYGLRGQVPDGVVFRVSSIDINSSRAYKVQQSFINSLMSAINPIERKWLMGAN